MEIGEGAQRTLRHVRTASVCALGCDDETDLVLGLVPPRRLTRRKLGATLDWLDGSVTRENLSTEAVRKRTDGSIALTASQWGGRQDIDLVLLFTQHRQHFEQLAQILREWRKKRISETNRPPPPPDPKACTEQGCALRATDRAAAKAQDSPVE